MNDIIVISNFRTEEDSRLENLLRDSPVSNRARLDSEYSSEVKNLDYSPEAIRKAIEGYILRREDHVDKYTGADVKFVSTDYLEKLAKGYHEDRVLGLYDVESNTYFLDKNLKFDDLEFVYIHEQGHALGEFSEYLVNQRAKEITGRSYEDVCDSVAV